jgi:signal transduction histidine kinase
MERSLPIREAKRIQVIVLVARATLILLAGLVGYAVMPVTARRPLPYALFPALVILALTAIPVFERALGSAHLAVVLALDVFITSMQAMPLLFLKYADRLDQLRMAGIPVQKLIEVSVAEPFLLVLIPIILLAWAYGRRGALWGSTWATILHVGGGYWMMRSDLLARGHLVGELLRIGLIYLVPLIVSTLARRERRHVAELEAAHARLRRHAATVEQLAVSRERNRLARELHDTLAHSLAALTVHLGALRTLLEHDPRAAEEATDRAIEVAREGLEESRQAIQALREDPLVTLGLVAAVRAEVESFENRVGVKTSFAVEGQEGELTANEARALFRIVEEALANVERHASADEVSVTLVSGTDRIDVAIQDNGVGFEASEVDPTRYGLIGMRERAEMIGAELAVRSLPGRGTEVWCSLQK